MAIRKGWTLRGSYIECCRTEGQCPLQFSRDMWDEPCVDLMTYQIKEGQISNVNMQGITIIFHQDGIGPKFADLKKGAIMKGVKGMREGAAYISDNATDEQRKILESFVMNHLGAERWRKCLGVKFVKIDISERNGTYHVIMPFGEQHMSLTTGGDGKTPVRIENPCNTALRNDKVCNTELWKYHDYGKNLEFHNTNGHVADFAFKGED